MARKKQQNIIRTEYLENWIGFYRARRRYEEASVLTKIARDIGAPIDIEEIEKRRDLHLTNVTFLKEEAIQSTLTPV